MDKTLLKGVSLLEALVKSPTPRGIAELADELGLERSNVHRILQTFVHLNYVAQDPGSRKYRCTLRFWELGQALVERLDVRHEARPAMRTLADATHETVHLSVLEGGDVLYVDKIDSPQPVRSYTRIGGRAPAYCVSTGKALLAFHDDPLAILPARLAAHTPRTVTTRPRLLSELEQVRKNGYSQNAGEWNADVCGMAAPIFDGTGRPIASLGLSMPAERFSAQQVARLAKDVVAAAAAVSARMGYAGRR